MASLLEHKEHVLKMKVIITSWSRVLLVEKNGVPGENPTPAASH
jgi:hypothetical protein